MTTEYVALTTWVDEDAEMFYEAGGIYDHEPHNKAFNAARLLTPSEAQAVCPRCGQRFAATEDGTAESHRDLHFDGDADIPSVCRNMPTKKLRLVQQG